MLGYQEEGGGEDRGGRADVKSIVAVAAGAYYIALPFIDTDS